MTEPPCPVCGRTTSHKMSCYPHNRRDAERFPSLQRGIDDVEAGRVQRRDDFIDQDCELCDGMIPPPCGCAEYKAWWDSLSAAEKRADHQAAAVHADTCNVCGNVRSDCRHTQI